MFDGFNRLHITAAALVLGLGAAGFATADGQPELTGQPEVVSEPGAAASNVEPLRCEILEGGKNGMAVLEGVVHSDTAISGTYSLRIFSVSSGGSSNISQGGEFSAAPGAPAKLGSVMLSNNDGTYSVTLEVIANSRTICTERTGSAT